jgi:uncharacterized membrane protein
MVDQPKTMPVRDMRIWISRILRVGVLISAVLILTGGMLYLFQHPDEILSFKKFSSQPDRLRHIEIIFMEALQLRSRSVIQLGILVLLATPLLRVIFSFIEFLINKDWIYVVITGIVIGTLCYSLFIN